MGGGDSGGDSCLVKGTYVMVPSSDKPWAWKSIETFEVGDEVMSYDDKYNLVPAKVTHVHEHEDCQVIKVSYWQGSVTITDNHWVATCLSDERGTAFMPVGRLGVCDALVNETGKLLPISSIEPIDGLVTTYNLTVTPNHTYICGGPCAVTTDSPIDTPKVGICVHNMGGGDSGGGGSKSESSNAVQGAAMPLIKDAVARYRQLYGDYYWPIEEGLASLFKTQLGDYTPYAENRFRELIGMAEETNPILDQNKKDLIRKLTEGEDILADRMRSTASQDVAGSFAQQRENLANKYLQAGGSTTSGSYLAGLRNMGTSEALAQAQARTTASNAAETEAIERQKYANDHLYTTPELGQAPTPGLGMNTIFAGMGGSQTTSQSSSSGGGGGGLGLK